MGAELLLISAGCVCTVISRPSSGPGPCPALLAPSRSQEGLVLDLVLFGALLPGRVSEKSMFFLLMYTNMQLYQRSMLLSTQIMVFMKHFFPW